MQNVYQISEYLYCPRQYFYHNLFEIFIEHEELKKGDYINKKYIDDKKRKSILLESKKYQLKGKIDYIKEKDKIIIYEIKKTKSSFLYLGDKFQMLAYILLFEDNNIQFDYGIVEYKGSKKTFRIYWDQENKQEIINLLSKIKNLNKIPPILNNKKCNQCSLKQFCLL